MARPPCTPCFAWQGIGTSLEALAVASLILDFLGGNTRPGEQELKGSLYALGRIATAFELAQAPLRARREDIAAMETPFIAHLERERFVLVSRIDDHQVHALDGGRLVVMPLNQLVDNCTGFLLAKRPDLSGGLAVDPVPDNIAAFVWG